MSEGDEQITTHKGLTLPESAIVHYAAVVVVVSLSGCNFVSLSILFFFFGSFTLHFTIFHHGIFL